MTLIKFNSGGKFSGTAGTSQPLKVTIEGETFETEYNSTASQTVTDFVAEHAQDIADRYGMLAVANSAEIELWGAQGASISTNGSSNAVDLTDELEKNVGTLETVALGSSTQVVYTFSGASASDTVTVDVASEADMRKLREEVERSSTGGDVPFSVQTAHKAVAS